MKNVLSFSVESAEILDTDPTSQFATARIEAFSTGVSRHNTTCDFETLKRTAPTIYEKPIVFEYDDVFGDFGTHTKTPIISGFVVPGSADFFERPDGRYTLTVRAKIWKRYAEKFVNVFKVSDDAKKKVSVEIEILDSEKKNDIRILKDWVYSAVCVLGELVTEASPGAQMEMLSFAKSENKEYKQVYNMEFGKYDEIDFIVPENIKSTALKALKKNPKVSGVALSIGKSLSTKKSITPKQARRMYGFLKNKNIKDVDSSVLALYGGMSGYEWVRNLVEKMIEMDNRDMSYFSNDEMGKGKSIYLDKSKDSLSMIPWGQIDKTELRNKILSASNYKQLVKNVYLLVESGWEDSPSEHLKYPVMQLKDGKLVYNRYGLASALQRAEGQNESSVVSKVHKIYNTLGIDTDNQSFSDDNYLGLEERDNQMGKEKELMVDEEIEKEDVKGETEETAEEKEEMSAEMNHPEKFSYASLFATEDEVMSMFAEDEEDDEETKKAFASAKEEFVKGENRDAMYSGLKCAFAKMARKMAKAQEERDVYMAENKELREFRASVEEKQKMFAVQTVLDALSEKFEIPAEKVQEWKSKSMEVNYSELGKWENDVKAEAVDFAIKGNGKKEDEFMIYALPFTGESVNKPAVNDVWADTN